MAELALDLAGLDMLMHARLSSHQLWGMTHSRPAQVQGSFRQGIEPSIPVLVENDIGHCVMCFLVHAFPSHLTDVRLHAHGVACGQGSSTIVWASSRIRCR